MHKKLFIALMVVLIAAGGIYFYARHRATRVVDEQVERLVSSRVYDSLEYESLNLGMTGDLELENVRVSKNGSEVVLQEVSISNMDYAHETPWHLDVEVRGLHFPNGLPDFSTLGNAPVAALLRDVVQDDTVPLSMRYSYDYDPEQDHQLIYNASTALPQYFTLTMDSESRNVPLETLMALNNGSIPPEQAMATVTELLSTLAVPRASIVLQDQGVVDAWIDAAATERNIAAADLREQLKSQVSNFYLFLPQNAQGIAMQSGIQVAAFLDGGRTLSVAIRPEYEGNFSRLQQEAITAVFTQDFKKVADLLHLEIQTQ